MPLLSFEAYPELSEGGDMTTGQVDSDASGAGDAGLTTAPGDAAIEARELRVSYGDRVAVHDLTFSLPRGEVLGVLGPNGAGKTTAIRVLTTVLEPSGGTFAVAGGRVHLWVGGGIVWDSDAADEVEESWTKARPLLHAIGAQLPLSAARALA